jgi:hypothetical protein
VIRELPKVNIGGTEFFIDLRLDEFRQVSNPYNRIEFVELMENEEGYVLCFDTVTKSAFHGTREEFDQRKSELMVLQLPKFKDMDPVGFELLLERLQDNMVDRINESYRALPSDAQQRQGPKR